VIRRIFWLFFGLGFGLLLGAFVVKRMNEATKAVAPSNLATQAGRAAGSLTQRMQVAMEEGRRAAQAREAELRATYDVPTIRESFGR
jgi:hypothetical protein